LFAPNLLPNNHIFSSLFFHYLFKNNLYKTLIPHDRRSNFFELTFQLPTKVIWGNFLSTIKYCVLVHYFQQLSNEKLCSDKNRTAGKLCSRFPHLPWTRESIANCSLSTGKKQQAACLRSSVLQSTNHPENSIHPPSLDH